MAGWGANDSGVQSQILQQVDVPYVSKSTCSAKWEPINLFPEQVNIKNR